ncbi:MAG: AMP-dependent synthetase, partial [Chloroflexi bacterium]|nr:AMP-dependent synthetase [Chloroflexota bacterium]
MTTSTNPSVQAFLAERDRILALRTDLEAARAAFHWPELDEFNWALDYFDTLPADQLGLWLVNADGDDRVTFGELRLRSNRVANYLRAAGVRRGDRILLLL